MRNVLIDLNRLRENPNNGLYQFTENLGNSLASITHPDLALNFYLPKNKFNLFGNLVNYVPHHSIDKFYMQGTSKYDVWHTTNQISWYKPFNKKTKRILTIHDLNFLIEEKEKLTRNKRLLKEIQHRIDSSHFITTISNYTLQAVQEHLDLRNLPTKVIYNGAYLKEFPAYSQPVYRPEKPFLFSIGSMQPRKNFHSLIPLLFGNDYELVIAGNNNFEYKNKVIEAAKKWNVFNRIKLIGAVSEQDKYWYYQHCLAFLFPSLAEGFGLPIIEAMQMGKAVFLSKETCLPEIGGDVAYYFSDFEPASMKELFNQGMHDFISQNKKIKTKERANFFSWNNAANQYLEIYKNV